MANFPSSIPPFVIQRNSDEGVDEDRARSLSLGGFERSPKLARRSSSKIMKKTHQSETKITFQIHDFCKKVFEFIQDSNKECTHEALKQLVIVFLDEGISPLLEHHHSSTFQISSAREKKRFHLFPFKHHSSGHSLKQNEKKEIQDLFLHIQNLCYENSDSNNNTDKSLRKNWSISDLNTLKDRIRNLLTRVNSALENNGMATFTIQESKINLFEEKWKMIEEKVYEHLKPYLFTFFELENIERTVHLKKDKVFEPLQSLANEILLLEKTTTTVVELLLKKFTLINSYCQQLQDLSEALNHPGKENLHHSCISHLKTFISSQFKKLSEEEINKILKKCSEIINGYVENELKTKRVKFVKEVLKVWKTPDRTDPISQHEIFESLWHRFRYPVPTNFFNETQRVLPTVNFLGKDHNNENKDPVEIPLITFDSVSTEDRHILELEKLISYYIFGDQKRTFIEKFRQTLSSFLILSANENNPSLLSVYMKLGLKIRSSFMDLSCNPQNKNIKELNQITDELNQLFEKTRDQLQLTHSEVVTNYSMEIVAKYLFEFFCSFNQLFPNGLCNHIIGLTYLLLHEDCSQPKTPPEKIYKMNIIFNGVGQGIRFEWFFKEIRSSKCGMFEQFLGLDISPASGNPRTGTFTLSLRHEKEGTIPEENKKEIRMWHDTVDVLLEALELTKELSSKTFVED